MKKETKEYLETLEDFFGTSKLEIIKEIFDSVTTECPYPDNIEIDIINTCIEEMLQSKNTMKIRDKIHEDFEYTLDDGNIPLTEAKSIATNDNLLKNEYVNNTIEDVYRMKSQKARLEVLKDYILDGKSIKEIAEQREKSPAYVRRMIRDFRCDAKNKI